MLAHSIGGILGWHPKCVLSTQSHQIAAEGIEVTREEHFAMGSLDQRATLTLRGVVGTNSTTLFPSKGSSAFSLDSIPLLVSSHYELPFTGTTRTTRTVDGHLLMIRELRRASTGDSIFFFRTASLSLGCFFVVSFTSLILTPVGQDVDEGRWLMGGNMN